MYLKQAAHSGPTAVEKDTHLVLVEGLIKFP